MILHGDIWQALSASTERLPHALLFAGPYGVGKRELADRLAARLLCELPRAAYQPACGTCPSCLMFAAGSHPDYRLIQPEASEEEGESSVTGEKKKASKQIRIQQIRELEEFFHVGGHRAGARVCVIDPAEAMNATTANSLLKILEEPSARFYFIMISHRWRNLLPTLLSRARRIMFVAPPPLDAQAWLAAEKLQAEAHWLPFFNHAPLALADAARSGRLTAIASIVADLLRPQDALAQAARWETLIKADSGFGMEDLVVTVQKWLFDLARVVVGVPPRYLPNHHKALADQAIGLSLSAILQAQRQLGQLRTWANHPLNPRLFIEDLCTRAFRPLGI